MQRGLAWLTGEELRHSLCCSLVSALKCMKRHEALTAERTRCTEEGSGPKDHLLLKRNQLL